MSHQSDKPFDQQNSGGAKEQAQQKATATKDAASTEAKSVAQDAKASGQQVVGTAKAEAQQVVGEAKVQARDLLHNVRGEVSSQAGQQAHRLAGTVRTLADELQEMSQGADQKGMAAGLASQAGDQIRSFADQLEGREPAELLDDMRSFARRRPGAFLAGAALLGLVGGRLTRGLTADDPAEQARNARTQQPLSTSAQPAPSQGFGPAYTETVAPSGYGTPAQTGTVRATESGYASPDARIDVVGEPRTGLDQDRLRGGGAAGTGR